jgi:hypothetical protein
MTARPGSALDAERRAALNGAKLAALVTDRWGTRERVRGALGSSATLVEPAAAGGGPGATGWVLANGRADRALGPALVWADRHGVADLHLVADPGHDAAGALARQAALFTAPPAVWAIDGRSLVAAGPSPVATRPPVAAPHELVDLLAGTGLEIVVEGGMVRGEVNGLEVARIVYGETSAGVPLGAPQLEVGVGKADRELTAMVHGELAPVDQLRRVVEIVRQHRRPGSSRHPLNQLVPDRWLRAVLCRRPALVGLAALRPAEGARPRLNLTERDVAIAGGESLEGAPVVVACSVGIALDLVPTAADARATIDPSARLVLAVPERDDHPGTRRLAARLHMPAEVAPVPGDWRAAG